MLKRILSLVSAILLIFSLCACSSDKSETEESYNQEESVFSENNENISSQEDDETGSFIKECEKFYTEYFIEDYSGGLFEVSKNDSLLHGVYDHTGKEILPVKYDEIIFSYVPKAKKVFIEACYEDERLLFDMNGKQLQDITDKKVSFAESANSSDVYICVSKDNSTEMYDDSFTEIIATVPLKYVIPIVII